jgi:hypothetical protein
MAGVDPRDFIINTDYEMDKLVLYKHGTLTSSATIPHNLSYAPLAFGVWSTDSEFGNVNPVGEIDTASEPGYTPALSVGCMASRDNIILNTSGNTNGATLYYRIYAMQPSDINKAAPATSQFADEFILNTDYNYSKLCAKGEFTESGQSFEHGLGYLPQVMAWYQTVSNGTQVIKPLMSASGATGFKLFVTQRNISLAIKPNDVSKVYWRIYYDEA